MLRINADVWEKTLDQLKSTIDEQSFTTWLEPVQFESFEENKNHLCVIVPSDFFRAWLQTKYRPQIEQTVANLTGRNVEVVFRVDSQPHLSLDPSQGGSGGGGDVSIRAQAEAWVGEMRADGADALLAGAPRINPRYTFESFIVGESNRFACTAAQAVSDPTSKAYNPLFIYGGTGLGKTHLMHAIGNQLHGVARNMKVTYVTSEQFMNLFIDAIEQKRQMDFRSYFRRGDILLIDDIQFFMGKERTQTEFFHTFNALYDSGRKIVVSSDRPPKELAPLEERLRSRFEWGLIVDIQKPDLETRVAILRQKARQEGIQLPQNVLLFLAEKVTSNIRELEGTLLRLKAYSQLHRRAIDVPMARNLVGGLLVNGEAPARIPIESIQYAVCDYFGLKHAELLNNSRARKYCEPRHIAMYLCRRLTGFSLPDIGQRFGGRDHTSVLHACRRIERNLETNTDLGNLIAHLTNRLKEKST